MKTIKPLVLSLLVFSTATAFAQYSPDYELMPIDEILHTAIKFDNNWSGSLIEIQKKGTEVVLRDKKYAFLFLCANWKAPCDNMYKETLSNKDVGDFFNLNFINMRSQTSDETTRNISTQVTKALNLTVDSLPLSVFLDHNGEIIGKPITGFLTADQLMSEAKKAMATEPKKR